MLVVNCHLESGPQYISVRTPRRVLAVDSLDCETGNWLKFALEQMVQDTEKQLYFGVVARHIKLKRFAISLRYHYNTASTIDQMCARNSLGHSSFDGIELHAA